MILTGEKPKYWQKILSQYHFFLHKSHGVILDGTQIIPHREPSPHPLQTLLLMRILKQPTHTYYLSGAKPLNVWIGGIYSYQCALSLYRGADKSLARPGRRQTTATEDFNVHISYLLS